MTFLADDKCCVIQFAAMEPSPGTRPILPKLAPEAVEVPQAAACVLAGVARRSVEVLDGCGDPAAVPDARGPGRSLAGPVRPDAPGTVLEAPMVSRLAGPAGRRRSRSQGQRAGSPQGGGARACRYLSGSGPPGRGLAAAGTVAYPLAAPACRPHPQRARRAGDVHRPGQRPAGDGLPQLLSIRRTGRVPEC